MIEFQNADICPAVRVAFKDLVSTNAEENSLINHAAQSIDTACGILKRAYVHGSMSEHDHDEFLTSIEEAEDHLESLGVLEDHEYIRDDLEPRAAELLDVDHIDTEDEADEFGDEEAWIFGGQDRYTNSAS